MAELTDVELRRELNKLGMKDIGPITSLTRTLYVKKLNKLRLDQPKKLPSRRLIGFSSDESEDEIQIRGKKSVSARSKAKGVVTGKKKPKEETAPEVTKEKAVPRRSTRARTRASTSASKKSAPSLWNAKTKSRDQSLSDTEFDASVASAAIQASFYRKSDISTGAYSDDRFDSSESEDDVDAYVNSSLHTPANIGSRSTRNMSINTSAWMNDSDLFNNHSEHKSLPVTEFESAGRIPVSNPSNNTSIRSRQKKGQHTPRNNTENLATRINRNHYTPKEEPSGESSDNARLKSGTFRQQNNIDEEENTIRQQGFKTVENPMSYKRAQCISKVLVVVLLTFFVLIFAGYVYMRGIPLPALWPLGDSSSPDQLQIEKSMCSANNKESGCYSSELDYVHSRELLTSLFDLLSERAGDYECGYSENRNVPVADVNKYFDKKYGSDYGFATQHRFSLYRALSKIAENPQWKIRLLDKSLSTTDDVHSASALESDNPYMSLWCRLQKASMKVLYMAMFVLIVLSVVLLVVAAVRYRSKKAEQQKTQVYELVEQMIDALKQQHTDSLNDSHIEGYIAIPHLRDMLIAPHERHSKQNLWKRALDFLLAKESRLRSETQVVAGEEFEVLRWIQATTNNGKVWQGQAFGENSNTTMNYPAYSLTPCLKIRNMFDADMESEDNWDVRIQDAILEKCGDKHGIQHIAVDSQSKEGCVYVKCADLRSSGEAFKALHGWWFDGLLVTVKYLRLERYYEHFPDAVNANDMLQPSNQELLSMSQPYHKSLIESL